MSVAVELTVDDRKFIQGLIDAEAQTVLAANRSVATINRASELSLLGLQAVGVTVSTSFRVQAILIRTTINTIIQTRAAIITSNPLLAAETIITGGVMLYLLYQQLQAIETGRQQTSAQMAAAYTLVRQSGSTYI